MDVWWPRRAGYGAGSRCRDLPFDVMKFVGVEDPRTVKNRVHWDVVSDAVPGLVAHGATLLREPDDVSEWQVLADPAGNEFCVFAP